MDESPEREFGVSFRGRRRDGDGEGMMSMWGMHIAGCAIGSGGSGKGAGRMEDGGRLVSRGGDGGGCVERLYRKRRDRVKEWSRRV